MDNRKILVTGTSGHLGEAIARTLTEQRTPYLGVDLRRGSFTQKVGDLANQSFTDTLFKDVNHVIHCATLHKPHVATHTKTQFIAANITSTLNLLEASVKHRIRSFIFTSTTSTFGDAMRPKSGKPAVWVTENLQPIPKNIYGVTKTAAEDLCQLFHRNHNLPCLILKTSRFFMEKDDDPQKRDLYDDTNIKINEFLNRRLDVADAVSAHLLAIDKATQIGFAKYIISANSPFKKKDLAKLSFDAPAVVQQYFPDYDAIYEQRNWKMFPQLDRVYINQKARKELGWQPKFNFRYILDCLAENKPFVSDLSQKIGIKGYHKKKYKDGLYPV